MIFFLTGLSFMGKKRHKYQKFKGYPFNILILKQTMETKFSSGVTYSFNMLPKRFLSAKVNPGCPQSCIIKKAIPHIMDKFLFDNSLTILHPFPILIV